MADKLRIKAIRDQQKRMKPEECQKFVRLVLDARIINSSTFGQQLILELNNSALKYDIRSLAESQCIIWERSVGQRSLLPTSSLDDEWQMENQIVRLISSSDIEKAARDKTLESIGERLHTAYPGMRHSLVVLRSEKKTSNAFSTALIELQVMQQLSVLQVAPGVHELMALLRRFTKSIAEAQYKQQKSESLDAFKKYLANDKKQCVRVVERNGLGRLWQQHLNRLPLVTLEVAETIIGECSCPKKLFSTFERSVDPANALAELKINRGAPLPLQTDRRIGNVLSGKLYALYNTRDPTALI